MYTIPMDTLLYTLLLLHPSAGIFALLCLFAFCFLGVHLVKLAETEWTKTKPPKEEPPEKENEAPENQEPIYYIVERKQRRAKPSYGEPKRISFKDK